MPVCDFPFRLRRSIYQTALLAGTSALALALAAPTAQARPLNGGAVVSPVTSAVATATAGSQQAAAIAEQAQSALSRAAQAVQAVQALQAAARTAAQASASSAPNGLTAGGLVVDPRVTAGTDANLWQNISLPTQTTSNGQTTVTLTQTSQRAIATWEQFNVGKNTTVDFDQSGGNTTNGNSWVVLNRIDATGNPSQILGQIKADGTVLIINPNGVVFTGTSQINVHTLIAVAGDINSYGGNATNVGVFNSAGGYTQIGTTAGGAAVLAPADEDNGDTQFIDSGLFANGVSSSGGTLVLSASSAAGANVGVQVDAGAAISTVTGVSGFDNGGFVLLAGPQVSNAGSIATSAGQIILAAANTVYVTEPATGSTATSFTVLNPTLATLGQSNPQALVFNAPAVVGGSVVENDVSGLLSSTRGAITLLGDEVQQLGVAEATTSITRAGSITITTTGATTFGPDSLTAILPDENGETIPSDATSLAAFAAPSIAIATTNMDMQSGSLILAPGATMNVTSALGATLSSPAGRVLLESGSEIDLAGTIATRSVADYLYTFKVTANDVADTPLAQSLIGQTVTIDLALSGTRSDGESWVGSPLFASSGAGYLSNITQGIDQLLTKGGKLTIGTFADVLSAKGSTVDVSGGYVQFTGATIDTTRLAGSNGAVYDIGSADPFITYAGLAGELTVDHAHWDITQTWTDPLIAHGYYQAGYIDGVSAGGVSVTAVNPVLEGDLVGDIVIGAEQRLLAQAATGTNGAQATPDQLPTGAALAINIAALPTGGAPISDDVVLASAAPDILGADFALGSTLALPAAAGSSGVLVYSTSALSASDFGSISVKGADQLWMTDGASLSVLPGGSITLTGVSGIDGTLTAHAGKITLTGNTPGKLAGAPPTAAVTIGPDAVLDVSGLWVNDAGLSGDALQGAAYINGGSVSISTTSESTYQTVGTLNYGNELVANVTDATQSIVLAAGSVIDLESGGYVSTAGKLKTGSDGLPAGNGGSLSLTLYNGTFAGYSSYDAALGGYVFGADPSQSTTYEALAPTPPNGLTAAVAFDGTIYAAGLNKGGTFTLQASSITIDGAATAIASAAGAITLPTAFFTSGFSTYNLTSIYGGVDLTAGTTLRLKQQNYLLSAGAMLPASGAELRDFASLGYAADGLRQPVSLSLSQGSPGDGVVDVATAGIVIPQGAAIVADPQADIALNAIGAITVEGSIVAPAGAIAFNQSSSFTAAGLDIWIGADAVLDVDGVYVANPLVAAYATGSVLDAGSITLGGAGPIIALAGSQFDLAGASATIEQPTGGLAGGRFAAQQIWSDGGTLTFTGNSLYFGGTIDAAGGAPLASGGTLNLGAVVAISSGTAVDAYNDIVIAESGDMAAAFAGQTAPATQSDLKTLTSGVTGATAFITAETLNASGLDSVSLTGPIAFSGNVAVSLPDALYLNGAITLLAAGVTPTSPASASTPTASGVATIGATQVTLDAGYIRFLNAAKVTPTLADGTLTLDASAQIDLAGVPVVSNAAQVNLISGGDISFLNNGDSDVSAYLRSGYYSYSNAGYATGEGTTLASSGYGGLPSIGALLVPDNLTLTAREVYPAADEAFLLMSLGLDPRASTPTAPVNTITFYSNGKTPYAPLSAGGAILVDAPNIDQGDALRAGGALYAPLGTIQLGYGSSQTLPAMFVGAAADASGAAYDPVGDISVGLFTTGAGVATLATVATQSVTLAPGSLTSVSAAGLDIPYGTTVDGANWSDGGLVLNGPPAKLIVLAGASVVTQAGATIDASGGGDVYATEFVAGTGGSRDVLATANTYALVPSYEAKVAAYDPTSGETVALGSAVTLAGGDGIAAGTYTLLPASYATLPGAYRVVVMSTNTGSNTTVDTVAADGSIYLTGTLTNAVTGARSSSTAMLEIQPDATWTKYSEIDINYGDSYFAKLAATNDTATPRLAGDAGQLVVAAANALVLDATNRFAPASGGRGGEVDITGANIVVAASDLAADFTANSAYAGYLILDADQISDLGAESVLIGGARAQTSAGTLITATALNLEVDSDAAHPLTGPDLLLVSLAPTVANAADHGLTVDAGSVIAAKGAAPSSSAEALIFGVDPAAQYQTVAGVKTLTGYSAGVSGDGSLLRISNGGLVSIARNFVPGLYTPPATTPTATGPASSVALGSLAIGAGVSLSGNTLAFDTSGAETIAASDTLAAKNFDLYANLIGIGAGTSGLALTPALIADFAGADAVSLHSASAFNLYGANAFGSAANPIGTLTFDGSGLYSDGGTTTIVATNVVFVDNQTTANSNGANLGGTGGALIVDASGAVTFSAGAKTFAGFAQASFAAGSQILFTGSGSLDAKAANVALAAPAVVADDASVQSLTTTGALTLAAGAGTAPTLAASDIGGSLTITAASIADSGTLIAQGGKLTLEATSGDLTLASGAALDAAGTAITLFDLAEDTPGGTIKLISDNGAVTLAAGSLVDVAAAGNGYSGTLAISAAGAATLAGALEGGAAYDDLGGTFVLSANSLAGGLPIGAGFTASFSVELGQGDIVVAQGQTLTSANVLLVANDGSITVNGTIDASSPSGGTIALYGAGTSNTVTDINNISYTNIAGGVTIGATAQLLARYQADSASDPAYANGASTLVERGGTITLGTTGLPSGALNATYGYETINSPQTVTTASGQQTITSSGAITVASDAVFDVSGGPADPTGNIDTTGGAVYVRAPILSNNNVDVSFKGTIVTNATASGAASGDGLVLDAFAVWSTTDSCALITGGCGAIATVAQYNKLSAAEQLELQQHFDGIIDPAGFFDANGNQLIFATNDLYPTSTASAPASGAYLPHVDFYQTTLLNFVNSPFSGASAAVAADFAGAQLQIGGGAATALPSSSLHLRPAIDLVNPSTAINSGNITVASNWNLGAGTEDGSGNVTLEYRTTNGGEPGVLTLQAANNVAIDATITDGFYTTYSAGDIAQTAYANEAAATAYQTYLGSLDPSNGILEFARWEYYKSTSNYRTIATGSGDAIIPSTSAAYGQSFFCLSTETACLNSLSNVEWSLQKPYVFSGNTQLPANAQIVDQYRQFYVEYVDLFDAYVSYFNNMEKTSTIAYTHDGLNGWLFQRNGVSLSAVAAIPEAPAAPAATDMTPYYDIKDQLGYYSTANYASSYWTYILSSLDYYAYYKSASSTTHNTGAGTTIYEGAAGTSPLTNLSNISSAISATGSVLAVEPPYAPPAYTTLYSATYVASKPITPPPADQIANNPTTYNGTAVYNTTSAASLMTAVVSGEGSFSYDIVGGAYFPASGAASVDPNAVVSVSSLTSTVTGDVTINGHTSYANTFTISDYGVTGSYGSFTPTIDVPTLVRTGTGDITIAAAGSFQLLDATAPGVVYTAGAVAANAAGFTAPTLSSSSTANGLLTTPAWASGGGDVAITAGLDIVGIETPVDSDGSQTGGTGVSTGQFWSAWYFTDGSSNGTSTPFAGSGVQYSAWVNTGTFFQGVGALGGGNVTLEAGRNVTDISASLPETIQVSGGTSVGGAPVAHYYGGGDLLVRAGGDLYSSTFYVGRGTGLIQVGGEAVADPKNPITGKPTEVATTYYYDGIEIVSPNTGKTTYTAVPLLLAVQDGSIAVQALGDVTLGGVFEPTRIPADTLNLVAAQEPAGFAVGFDSYGASSGVSLLSATGDFVWAGTDTATLFAKAQSNYGAASRQIGALPPTLDVEALSGDITIDNNLSLFPSASGSLTLAAGGTLTTQGLNFTGYPVIYSVAMLDGDDSGLESLLGIPTPTTLASAVHADDPGSVILYAGEDISGDFSLIEQAKVETGRDIINTTFTGQNNSATDVTSIIADRDILSKIVGYDDNGAAISANSTFVLYGPGDFLVEAGRNLGPFNTGAGGGIFAVGDGSNCSATICNGAVKSYLPVAGADITALFGVGDGVDYAAAIADYVDPANAGTGGIDYLTDIASILGETPAQAWTTFEALSPARQKLLVERAFLDFLTQVGLDYNNASSPYHLKYARAYETIATLFPAAYGYTANGAGGANGASVTVHTGDLTMAHSLIETQTGGDINILGPGGNIYVGSNAADSLTPSQEGVLTLQGGSIGAYADGSVEIYQSRIFTEQGGDVDLFSANGDLNAGKGPKSSAAYPPLKLICDADGYCRVSPAGLVTGAGIGALLSVPGQDPSKSNVVLTAPHGTVDAGAAGIRVAGNLNIVALQVLNAFNIQVGGTAVGVPVAPTADVGALTTAGAAAGAAAKSAEAPTQSQSADQPSIIMVEILGFGGGDGTPPAQPQTDDRSKKGDRRSQNDGAYDPYSPVHLLGNGALTDWQKRKLTADEKSNLENLAKPSAPL
jgi:filamentous hemagglutinin family protein